MHNINSTHAVNNGLNNNTDNTRSNNKRNFYCSTLYKRLSGRLKKTCNSLGVQVYFKGNNTIYTLHMGPKDKDNIGQNGVINWFKYPTGIVQKNI